MREYLSKVSPFLAMVALFLVGFTVTAHAADALATPTADPSWIEYARPVYEQIMSGHYIAACAFGLVLCVALLKGYADKISKRFAEIIHTDGGGVVTTFVMSYAGAVATATAATGSGWAGLTTSVLSTSGVIALAAIGGYVGVKKFIIPILTPLVARGPEWLQKIYGIVLFIFDRPSPVQTAEAAGDAAVAANPAPGTKPTTGEPETF